MPAGKESGMSTRQDKGAHGTLREEDNVNAGADPRIDHYATRPDGTVYAVYRPKMIVPDESDPKIYREFWAAAAEALKDYRLTWDKSVDHSAALETLRALAEKHGNGEAEWTEYLYLESAKQLGMAHDRGLEPYVQQLELKNKLLGLEPDEAPDLMHYRLQDIYNGDDTDAVKYLLEPVVRFLDWMKKAALSERDGFIAAYHRIADELRLERRFPIAKSEMLNYENYPSIDDRANLLYAAFLDALSRLPDDSKVFTEYFSESFVPSSPDEASAPPGEHTAALEASVRASIGQYGAEEGLRRLILSTPEWVERVMRSRGFRRGAPPPPASEIRIRRA